MCNFDAVHVYVLITVFLPPFSSLCLQFAKLHPDKKQISVGVVGYPNVGKSSIINTLKKKKVGAATGVWYGTTMQFNPISIVTLVIRTTLTYR